MAKLTMSLMYRITLLLVLFSYPGNSDDFKRILVDENTYMESKLQALETKLRNEFNSVFQNMSGIIATLQTEVNLLRHHVAFYATLSAHKSLGQEQTVEFDKVITNIGGAYSGVSGVFTVPVDGIYHVSTTMFSDGSSQVHTEIMLNSNAIGRNFGNSNSGSGTMNVLIKAKKADLIYVRHMADRTGQVLYGNGYASFSGFLVE